MKKEIFQKVKDLFFFSIIYFFANSFVISVSFLIFFRSIQLEEEEIRTAAPETFYLIIILTVFFVLSNLAYRRYAVDRPLRTINEVLSKVAHSDFSSRVNINKMNTYFKPVAKSINSMSDELAASTLLKTDFIANVSHELKTPLAVIGNYATLLQSGALSDEQIAEYAKTIQSASVHMSELVSNILKLTKLENQQFETKKEIFNLSNQLTDILLSFENIWDSKQIELDVDIAEDVMLNSDEELLSIIWTNILSNAFKFTNPGDTVKVSLYENENSAIIEVSDTGCGMNEETAKHIFDKFYQGDTSHATQGNGLGLALVKRVTEIIGGEIMLKSVLGMGSTFTVKVYK